MPGMSIAISSELGGQSTPLGIGECFGKVQLGNGEEVFLIEVALPLMSHGPAGPTFAYETATFLCSESHSKGL
jgi:hypothetical protein